jgi:lysophospholipase L1-like esterase
MMRGKSSRSNAGARADRGRLWRVGAGLAAVTLMAGLALIALGLPENPPRPTVPPTANTQAPEDTAAAPEDGTAEGSAALAALAAEADATGDQVVRETKSARITPPASKLGAIYEALLKLESASGTEPVTILHLGDSHIASDRITGEVRRLLQARFGDGGRGLMMPGFPFPYYKAPGFNFEKTGKWTAANSLTEDGVYGITGVSLTGSGAEASLTLSSTSAPFTEPEVSLLAAPGGGHAVISATDRSEEVATGADARAVLRVKLPVKTALVEVKLKGDGPVTVLGFATGSGVAGVRYVNLGIPSASALTTRRFDRALAASDIFHLAPKLVVLGYGTNEGFIDGLDLDAYEKDYVHLLQLVKAAAPDAALLILGPLDGTRLPGFVKGEARAQAPCRPLGAEEQANYEALLAKGDASLGRWHEPPKLEAVRSLLQRLAGRYHATYWDLSAVMGGPCSIDRWAKAEPRLALPDHVHLSDEGSRLVGRAIYEALVKGYDRYRQQSALMGGVRIAAHDRSGEDEPTPNPIVARP